MVDAKNLCIPDCGINIPFHILWNTIYIIQQYMLFY